MKKNNCKDVIVTVDYFDEPIVPAHANGMTRDGIRALVEKYRNASVKAIAWRVANLGVGAYYTKRLATMKWVKDTPHPDRDRRFSPEVKYITKDWPPERLAVPYQKTLDSFDPLAEASAAIHESGMEFWVFVDLYDEQFSPFLHEHPECLVKTKDGATFPGLRDYSNPVAVREKLADIAELFPYHPDAIYLSTSCHARHLHYAEEDDAFGKLPGEKMTDFLRQLKQTCASQGIKLIMGLQLGKTMDFCSPHWQPHPKYRVEQDWKTWVDEGLVSGLLLGDYEPVWSIPNYWKVKGLDKLEPGKMPLDVFVPEIRDYVNGRAKLFLFTGWLTVDGLPEYFSMCSRETRKYGLDGYFAHESAAIEQAPKSFEALRESWETPIL